MQKENRVRKIVTLLLSVLMMFLTLGHVFADSIDRGSMPIDVKSTVGRIISYYEKGYRADLIHEVESLESLNSDYGLIWSDIVETWDWIENEMVENIGVAPSGLENPEKHAFIVLGFALNSDGTMTNELIGRLEVAKASADLYPQSYILVTGGVEKNGWTEGKRMRDWLIANGIDESRIIVEELAPDTAGNATNSYEMLYNDYEVDTVSIITSQYHLRRSSILYYTESVLKAYELNKTPIKFLGNMNAGWYRSDKTSEDISLKANSLRLVAGVNNENISTNRTTIEGISISGKTDYTQGESLDWC